MPLTTQHTVHIPVMGLGYTIDTPLLVGRYGISSVVSIIEDNLIEIMRKYYCGKNGEPFEAIEKSSPDSRARRITAYLNLMGRILKEQTEKLRREPFRPGNEITKYFEMLPDNSPCGMMYKLFKLSGFVNSNGEEEKLRACIRPGSIDVNIMTKCDRMNYAGDGAPLPPEYSDAMAALRGFATSNLTSSVVFSAGLNPRLYGYCETFSDFLPDENGFLKKKITLKVSDFRSAMIQGKFLAKKGLWISEFRIESGLNCGGHAFATDGLLLGPILQEFKDKRAGLNDELFQLCQDALLRKEKHLFKEKPANRVTVQGGIGTATEDAFLREYFGVDGTGWGSPFLLVPEATNVDSHTLQRLTKAKQEDYFLSHASPLGIPFHNLRDTTSEIQRKQRISKGRPGSPCYLKYLAFNTEFTETPICVSSREYQEKKIRQLKEHAVSAGVMEEELEVITEKDCLCEGLTVSALIKHDLPIPHKLNAVVICPGPNLAYFTGTFSLQEMTDHIYGRKNLLNTPKRPHMFINELTLYVDYLKNQIQKAPVDKKQSIQHDQFRKNLFEGINFYLNLIPDMWEETPDAIEKFREALGMKREELVEIEIPC